MYYLRRTFGEILKIIDGNDKPDMKIVLKNYNILMAVKNIGVSWDEIKNSCMKGSWRKLWPEYVNTDVINPLTTRTEPL